MLITENNQMSIVLYNICCTHPESVIFCALSSTPPVPALLSWLCVLTLLLEALQQPKIGGKTLGEFTHKRQKIVVVLK